MGMIPNRGNWLGLGMFVVVGGLVAFLDGFVLKPGDTIMIIAVGAAPAVADVAFRVVNRANPKGLFGKETGGNFFFFVPVWILGLLVVLLNSLIGAGVKRK